MTNRLERIYTKEEAAAAFALMGPIFDRLGQKLTLKKILAEARTDKEVDDLRVGWALTDQLSKTNRYIDQVRSVIYTRGGPGEFTVAIDYDDKELN
jgi:hypothetical protein